MGYSTEKNETSEILVFLLRLFALEFEIQVDQNLVNGQSVNTEDS